MTTPHGVGKAILATVAAILLSLAGPTVANIAQNIGSAAAQQSLAGSNAGAQILFRIEIGEVLGGRPCEAFKANERRPESPPRSQFTFTSSML